MLFILETARLSNLNIFKCGDQVVNFADRYTYLGVLLTEHLYFDMMAKAVALSASRALGLLIAKSKLAGGFTFDVFTKLYDSLVCPIIDYSSSIWGFKTYSCINAVQHRAMRFFLGVGRYTPISALFGEMGWDPPIVRQWTSISRYYVRLSYTNHTRLNKRIALWASDNASLKCKNWYYLVHKHVIGLDLNLDLS